VTCGILSNLSSRSPYRQPGCAAIRARSPDRGPYQNIDERVTLSKTSARKKRQNFTAAPDPALGNSDTIATDRCSLPERPDRRHARILYVIGSLDVGGSERHLAAIAPRLRQHGWQTSIYCLSHRGALADGVEEKGVPVVGTPDRLPARSRLLRLSRLVFSCLALFFVLLRRRGAGHRSYISFCRWRTSSAARWRFWHASRRES
jgi:hypothetical protein